MLAIARSPRFLRRVLWIDAASCAGSSLLQLLAAPALAQLLGMDRAMLVASGFVLIAVAGFACYLASCDPVPRAPVWLLIAGNWAWVAGCLVLLFGGAASTGLGQGYLAMQAAFVAVIAELEWLGLRAGGGAWEDAGSPPARG